MTLRLSALWLSALMMLGAVASAGQKPSPPGAQKGSGSIKGRVLDETGRPFANAVVYVSPLNGVYSERRQVATDESGSFQAAGLARRPYAVECRAKGYLQDYADAPSARHLIGEFVTLRLIKSGVITGTVTDSQNEAVVNAEVSAIRVRDADGRAVGSGQDWGSDKTDDRGIYRIYGLEAGAYLIVVRQVGAYEDNSFRNEAPVFYPSATRGGAQEVTVARGAVAEGINITYRREPGHTISGRCSGNISKSDEAFVKLIEAESGVLQQGGWDGYKNGAFAIYGVPDGDYYMVAQDQYDEPSAASPPVRVSVRGRDVTGVELKLARFGTIAGRVVIEASAKDGRGPECKPAREASVEEMVVTASRENKAARKDPSASLFDTTVATAVDEKNDSLLQRLVPGQHHLRMEMPNEDLYVADLSIRTAAGDVADAARTGLAVKAGESVTNVTIKVRDGAAAVRGRVTGSGEQSARLRAHLVPAERESQDDALRFAETVVRTDGGFLFTNIAPGRYRLLVRPAAGDEEAVGQAGARTASGRAALRRDAEAADAEIDLKPCQRVTDYSIRYRQRSR